MRISVISAAKTKEAYIKAGEDEYARRLKSWCKLELSDLGLRGNLPEEKQRLAESIGLTKLTSKNGISEKSVLIILDERGKKLSSPGLAKLIGQYQQSAETNLIFAIGGPYGWSENIKAEADFMLSLSDLTFTYQFARLILIEQIYRAFTILKGLPYHH